MKQTNPISPILNTIKAKEKFKKGLFIAIVVTLIGFSYIYFTNYNTNCSCTDIEETPANPQDSPK
ncbi:hypothetical protein [Cytobacillus sp. IB215316]|uniref:hypothetical protein n=1 Tax=Cytobacillus sp. IB215316 TaxID=3097354 RepID=UPI002A10D826|nr:hypothetical protein [Cytobacillus sp. IB215316]MDX8362998.1 hypothetical protein [Cytobacillus sp. IB215316]